MTAASCLLKPEKKTKKKYRYVPANLAVAKEIREDAAGVAVLSDLDDTFTLKARQRMTKTKKDFLGGKDVFALLPTDFGTAARHRVMRMSNPTPHTKQKTMGCC